MMQASSPRWSGLFLFLALLLGAAVRVLPVMMAGAAINDGGMFTVMIEDLKANGFLIPAATTYNHLGIPFAYPPLGLYLGGALTLLGIRTLDVVRWLPPVMSTLSILAFYWMAMQIFGSGSRAALASLAYALVPRSFSWYVMGGGLSRSLGILFLLLTCGSTWLLLSRHQSKYILLTALFGAGAVLSHPETGLHTAAACGLIWLFRGRTWHTFRSALIVAAGVILLTSPWWGTVLAVHGFAPFQSALHAGEHSPTFWLSWLIFDFADERFVSLITVLGLIGVAARCLKREWFLPAWLLLPFAVEPRSATAIAALPLAMLAADGLGDVVLPKLVSLLPGAGEASGDWTALMTRRGAARIILGYVWFLAFFGAFAFDLSLRTYVVPPESQAAMQWVGENTPKEARFIVLTGRLDPFSDPSIEWFPVLADRTNNSTIQGREWLLGARFMTFLVSLRDLQTCVNQAPSCVEKWASAQGQDFDYLYIEKPGAGSLQPPGLLAAELRGNPGYSLVFENGGAVVFQRIR